jgi:ADP-heptose:LPS heptosyltransferase
MNIALQRAADRLLGIPLCAFLSLLDRMFRRPVVLGRPRSILVILLSEMGALVLAEPMFTRLKSKYPEASIHALVFAKNREVLDLLAVIAPTNVHTLDDRSLWSFLTDSLRVLRHLRSLELDAVLDCELFSRISSIFSYLSGARIRAGFHRHTQEGLYRGSFINRPVMYNPYRHLTLQLLGLVSALESTKFPLTKDQTISLPEGPPLLKLSSDEKSAAIAELQADFPAIVGRRLVLVYPGGGLLPIRAWPLESYVKVCSALIANGYAVGVVGQISDRPLNRELVSRCASERCIDLAGYTKSVRHLIALFHRADLMISNDGGPAQFTALAPLPSIVLFGPETPLLYRPLSHNTHCLYREIPCSPCLTAYNHRKSPCDGDNQCLKQISPAAVLAKALELLAASGAASATRSFG